MSAINPSGMPIAVPSMAAMGRLLVGSLVTLSTGASADEVGMEEPDAEVGAAVMKAVLTMVEMTPFEFEVIVVNVEVAFIKIWCQQLINSTMSIEQDGRNGAENILPLLV